MSDDVLARAQPFLNQCPSCDAGLPSGCTCPQGDYRPVMLDLVREVERLRARVAAPIVVSLPVERRLIVPMPLDPRAGRMCR